jgi:hypothetical protein
MRPVLAASALLAAAFAAACATTEPPPPPQPVLAIAAERTCDADIKIDAARPLTPPKPRAEDTIIASFDASTACIERDGAKLNYVVFKLPDFAVNHTLTVGGANEALRTAAVSVSMLDATGAVKRSFGRDKVMTYGAIRGVQLRPGADEAFVLVMSDPETVGKVRTGVETAIAVSPNYAYNSVTGGGSYNTQRGFETNASRTYSFEGTVVVKIVALTGKIGAPAPAK